MKLTHLATWSLVAMTASCTTVYAVVPPGAAPARAMAAEAELADGASAASQASTADSLLTRRIDVTARAGHARLVAGGARRTYVLVELGARALEASESASRDDVPSNTALVIDRSGSMSGSSLAQAVEAVARWIEQSSEQDVVSVLAFDDGASTIVEPKRMTDHNRRSAIEALRSLSATGSTCMSCGVEAALEQFDRDGARVRRMVVLSDGHANQGVVTRAGFQALASRCRDRSVTVTTVGLGLDYGAEILSAFAFEGNGRHHFVESAASLPELFRAEAAALRETVATALEARIELPDGVSLVGVAERSHRRTASGVVVPLGDIRMGQQKTVLLEVEVSPSMGDRPLADVFLTGQDPRGAVLGSFRRTLRIEVHAREQSPLDPRVGMRLERSRTVEALRRAGELFAAGKGGEAEELLRRHGDSLDRSAAELWSRAAAQGDERAGDIRADLARQREDTRRQRARFRRAVPQTPSGERAMRRMIVTGDPWKE